MPVIAIFKYQVKPGRMADFMAKLQEAASTKFSSKVMPKSFRLFHSTCARAGYRAGNHDD